MSRDSFRQAIFNVVEHITNYELSPTAQKLILHYFNGSKQKSSYERAIAAITKYYPEGLGANRSQTQILEELLVELKKEADKWDRE
ncbi:MAG: hypothetical protein JXK07_11595 [Spirochaetes bacterium]|nr:hypothetical protein [Spirochaetota bacterium]MBN2770715.1 hypothetical protein [Spirochaetota bacterium]